ncbi:MAG: DUF362 domain-containing protein, partial [Bacteroidales bacterium]|nr:DUF362 domain-containing protein [Bacteroidales bacterium]
IIFSTGTLIYQPESAFAAGINNVAAFTDPLGPNSPIGVAKGILPGRVVWVYNPDATNENCTNANYSDAYWLEKNCNQDVVDKMFSDGIMELTGKETHAEAWDAIFRYFNMNHGKGDTGYSNSETIFVKINAVTAYSGLQDSNGDMTHESIEFDTSPQTIMALLRQLVNEAKVPQENIYIGDPMADVYNYMVSKFSAEFPEVHYVSKRTITGRTKITASNETGIWYSDKGTVMNEIKTHKFFEEMMDADYLLNIPSMKGHRWGGVTMFAKNHFGSNTTSGSWQLHKGLMNPDNTPPLRTDYKMYRVFVDLMASKYLGGNTLLYFMDALWSTSYEHQKPQKFQSTPFNNDWCSSILLSLDPVAIESVGIDILQKEFTEEDMSANPSRYTFVQWNAVDDYLHQAASSEWWPDNITYDPDNSGLPIGSLGVHEHWNNNTDMQYSRNLGNGEGIELIKIFDNISGLQKNKVNDNFMFFPNPVISIATISFNLSQNARVRAEIFTVDGKQLQVITDKSLKAGNHYIEWNPGNLNGLFLIRCTINNGTSTEEQTEKIRIL